MDIPYKFIHFKDRDDKWSDIAPVPQFSPNVKVLQINYSERYKEINDYFRAVILKNEISKRVFDLTSEVISENPANYMAWHIRRKCLDSLPELKIEDELNWLDSIIVEYQKNYQIWMHRKVLIDKLNDSSHELEILNKVYQVDSKNFHAWCHRIWVMRRFNIYENEFKFIDDKLNEDVKNNSVWNYRFFIVNYSKLDGIKTDEKEKEEKINDVIKDEINYALDKIKVCDNNESAYSYLRGFLTKFNKKYNQFPQIKETLLTIYKEKKVNHCMSMLVDIYEEEKNNDECVKILDELIDVDYIRRKYWGWRKDAFFN